MVAEPMPGKRGHEDPDYSPCPKKRAIRTHRALPSPPTSDTLLQLRAGPSSAPFTPRTPKASRDYTSCFSTPLRSTPFTIPSDSPTNPVGLERGKRLRVALPEVTSFSKHLALRFQVVQAAAVHNRRRSKARHARGAARPELDRAGVFRVVQVPLNYTFRHLHALILYLFPSRSRGPISRSEWTATSPPSSSHAFEVQRDVVLQSNAIKSGRTVAKLSTSYLPYEQEALSEDDNAAAEGNPREEGGWIWENEDEFEVGRVWPNGPELENGIIYWHSPLTAIHITLNMESLPRRSGRSNEPYVFRARGSLDLRTEVVDIAGEDGDDSRSGSVLPPSSDPYGTPSSPTKKSSDDEENEQPPPDQFTREALEGARWNNPGDFATFLRALAAIIAGFEHERSLGGDTDVEEEEDEPAFSPLTSSPSFKLYTPAPVRIGHQKRVDIAARRIRRLSQRSMATLDDEEDDGEKKVKDEATEEVKVELFDTEDGLFDCDEHEQDENQFAHSGHVSFASLVRGHETEEKAEEEEEEVDQLAEDDAEGDEDDEVPDSETESAQRQRARAFWDWSPDILGLREVEI
ncbi:hypothetical protein PUNSTDRAFT_44506 [Punctularia strigosozonata HHB-11173 SS5]|uniref:uncharacterized protein n=1 Tax=Punctularia strigosozonata (strain HHB-11173) TaxID=741275 RepID=UPI00044173A0|nr:uncharacterized protein PUNSTDRAFT_44506 [Punctularia strigosozonata HHB-11173 SS5]EIN09038.1 hypothetical protein PUNSTDRAFT_44506 [Punctularia strigosozonata HHB-11173 SS5]